MKLAIVGAGSTRLPLMLGSVASGSAEAGVDTVFLYDVQPWRIEALLPVATALAGNCASLPKIHIAVSLDEAVEGASAVIFTIRPGFEQARARDERICVDLGTLGQETTGPAGFAFAKRSIPAILQACERAQKLAPDFLPVIFTNPAGMVTQATLSAGFSRAIGICDSATGAVKAVSARSGRNLNEVDFEVYGLNHLSWTRKVSFNDEDLLGPALLDDEFMNSTVGWWWTPRRGPDRIPVEYLYYFYRFKEAVKGMAELPMTRGEELVHANEALLKDLRSLTAEGRTSEAVVRYARYLNRRNETYMDYSRDMRAKTGRSVSADSAIDYLKDEIGGYAEVAMELLGARRTPRLLVLNTANCGAINGLAPDDVVESDCFVNADNCSIRPHGPIPSEDLDLITRVKYYERLAIKSISENSSEIAIEALVAHPLIDNRTLAVELVGALGL